MNRYRNRAAAAAILAGAVACFTMACSAPAQAPAVNQDLSFQNRLRIPALLLPRAENGEKVFELAAQPGESAFFPGLRTRTLGFNGSYLGPTLRLRAGDRVRLRVGNQLDEPITVHWHGMHLPAAMDGGPHQVIEPGQTWQPYWTVENEASTLWYHSHLMGKTGGQVYRGLAGLIIVDDRNADALGLPHDYGVDDLPLVVQDRKFDDRGQLVYEPENRDALGPTGMLGDTILVNGTFAPYAEAPAKLLRFRLLNASNARRYNFGFEDNRAFFQVATDGGFLESPVARTRLILAPGERAEIVVDLTGDRRPLTLISDAVHERIRLLRFMRNLLGANRDENQVFKILELRPQPTAPKSPPLPQRLNSIEKLNAPMASRTRKFVLDPGSRTINRKRMDLTRVDEIARPGEVEIWQIRNLSGTYHPFHIHGVQFQILTRDGRAPEQYERGWKDTVLIPNAETVRVIMRLPEFSDPRLPYMYHCHILEHEDMGMMGQYLVVPVAAARPTSIY